MSIPPGPVTADCIVTATFAINTYTVTVNPGGEVAAGETVTITSSPAGVECVWNGANQQGTCQLGGVAHGTAVTPTASLPNEVTITWGAGCDSTTATTCTINKVIANATISPITAISTYTLGVTASGTGSGSVTGAGITCSRSGGATTGTCSAAVDPGTPVTLTATPQADSLFIGWTGACVGNVCSLTMDAPKTVNAQFALCTDLPAYISDKGSFPSITAAYVASTAGDDIGIMYGTYSLGAYTFDRPVDVTLAGMRDCRMGLTAMPTILNGSVNVGGSVLIMDGITIR